VGDCGEAVPLTDYQAELARLLSANRSPDSFLAGGAAILLEPNTTRYSRDLDDFSVSQQRFVDPRDVDDAVPHHGRPGGVLPRVIEPGV
jgi:hypothetical protein